MDDDIAEIRKQFPDADPDDVKVRLAWAVLRGHGPSAFTLAGAVLVDQYTIDPVKDETFYVSKLFQLVNFGKTKPSQNVLYDWMIRGARGIKLPFVMWGGQRRTNESALRWFFARLKVEQEKLDVGRAAELEAKQEEDKRRWSQGSKKKQGYGTPRRIVPTRPPESDEEE